MLVGGGILGSLWYLPPPHRHPSHSPFQETPVLNWIIDQWVCLLSLLASMSVYHFVCQPYCISPPLPQCVSTLSPPVEGMRNLLAVTVCLYVYGCIVGLVCWLLAATALAGNIFTLWVRVITVNCGPGDPCCSHSEYFAGFFFCTMIVSQLCKMELGNFTSLLLRFKWRRSLKMDVFQPTCTEYSCN